MNDPRLRFSLKSVELFKMTEELRQKIAQQIAEAFADTPYPGDNNIGWGCGWEGTEFEEVLRGKHWKDLTFEFIYNGRNQIPCMTPDGFRFYLPAFMIATLLHYYEVDMLPDNLIGSLCDFHNDFDQHFLKMVSKFNRREQTAILAFLKSYLQLYPQEYDINDPVYRPLLDKGIEFWERRLQEEAE